VRQTETDWGLREQLWSEYSARMKAAAINGRAVHAIRINQHCMADRAVIVWPADTSKL